MEKRKTFIVNFLYFAIILAAAYVLIRFGLPLLMPFVIAFVIAYFLKWPIRFVSAKLKIPRKLTAILMVILFYGTIGTLLTLLVIRAISSLTTLVQNLPLIFRDSIVPFLTDIFTNLEDSILRLDPRLLDTLEYLSEHLIQSLGQLASSLSLGSMGFLSSLASSLPMLFIKLLLMVISTFFLAMDYDRVTVFLVRLLNRPARNMFLQIKQYVVGTLFVCIRSYAIIMSITFVELTIGLSIIGISHAPLIALCIAIFDILPVLGTGGIMIPWAVIAALQGHYSLAVQLFIVYLVVTIVRNIIEPKIVGGQLGLHPVATLASMFVGSQLLGVVGLFGFPILLSLLRYLNDNGTIHIIHTDESPAAKPSAGPEE